MRPSPMRERSVAVPGGRVAYRETGDGPVPIVLLHGWPETGLCWRRVAPLLPRDATVIMPDLPGYGGSSAAEPGDKRAVARALAAFVAELGFASVVVVGHDRGARVAHRWALDRPDQVSRLAVLDVLPMREALSSLTASSVRTSWHWYFHAMRDVPERVIGADVEAYLRQFLGGVLDSGALDEATFRHYVRAYDDPERIRSFLADYRASFGSDLLADDADRAAGRRLGMPVLALWGARGSLGQVDVLGAWSGFADALTGRSLDCGHYLPEERPTDVAAALAWWLA